MRVYRAIGPPGLYIFPIMVGLNLQGDAEDFSRLAGDQSMIVELYAEIDSVIILLEAVG